MQSEQLASNKEVSNEIPPLAKKWALPLAAFESSISYKVSENSHADLHVDVYCST